MTVLNQATSSAKGEFCKQSPLDYQTIAASQTNAQLGTKGAAGDYIESIVLVVSTAATAATSISDGGASGITVFPNSPGGGVGTYVIYLSIASRTGGWTITTGGGVAAIVTGRFT